MNAVSNNMVRQVRHLSEMLTDDVRGDVTITIPELCDWLGIDTSSYHLRIALAFLEGAGELSVSHSGRGKPRSVTLFLPPIRTLK